MIGELRQTVVELRQTGSKLFPAYLPIGESSLSFKFVIMNMCLLNVQNKLMFVTLIHLIKLVGPL